MARSEDEVSRQPGVQGSERRGKTKEGKGRWQGDVGKIGCYAGSLAGAAIRSFRSAASVAKRSEAVCCQRRL